MPADFQGFQAELDLLREQVKSQLAAHRLEVAAALEHLAGARGTAGSGAELGAIHARLRDWERREIELGEKIAARTIEYQALRARAEIDGYRQQLRIDDLEKKLALAEAENQNRRSVLQALMAEHAKCGSLLAAKPEAAQTEQADLLHWKAQLEASQRECAALRASIENSLALKLARSLSWLLSPLRSLFAKRTDASGAKS